ncbi:MAG: YoaK family protein [bacterium]|nr:YoaK family protein [bacterium]
MKTIKAEGREKAKAAQSGCQMSETMLMGIILAVSGGFMDAYSYLYRDHVFANAQTGNMLLFGINLSRRNFSGAFNYLCPVIAFTLGIVLSDLVRHRLSTGERIHWRQFAVLLEAAVLAGVAFIPTAFNLPANSLTSLACGIQAESFRKIHGNAAATTMCIGNLRSGTQSLCDCFLTKDKRYIKKSLIYYFIILFFILGAVLGSVVINYLNGKAVLVCSAILVTAFFMMFIEGVGKDNGAEALDALKNRM